MFNHLFFCLQYIPQIIDLLPSHEDYSLQAHIRLHVLIIAIS
jgi:hypothetical protein